MALSLREAQSESEKRASDRQSVWPNWSDRTAVLIATGPSLTPQQVDLVHRKHSTGTDRPAVIAINEAGLRQYLPLAAPWAEILYAADGTWWRHYRPDFLGMCVSGENIPDVETIPLTMMANNEAMPHTPGKVLSGDHSGFQALGLALSLGVSKVLLLGYDCGGAQRNCHSNRPAKFLREAPFHTWVSYFNRVPAQWPEVDIVNCSEHSAITAFRKAPLEEVL